MRCGYKIESEVKKALNKNKMKVRWEAKGANVFNMFYTRVDQVAYYNSRFFYLIKLKRIQIGTNSSQLS